MDELWTPKEIREYTAMTQAEFAMYTGIPARTIEQWESGQRRPPEYVLRLLQRAIIEDADSGRSGKAWEPIRTRKTSQQAGKVLTITQAELPGAIKGATIRRAENNYSVFLNQDQEQLRQLIALWHEVAHIWRGDLECNKSAEEVEEECRETMLKAARAILEE